VRLGCTHCSLLIAVLLVGCSGLRRDGTRPPVEKVAAAVAIDWARSMVDLVEVVFVRAPKAVLVDLPLWAFHDVPRSLIAQSSVSGQVAMLLEDLRDDAREEVRVAAGRALRQLTGLPIEDAVGWRAWWRGAGSRPPEAWRGDLADTCIADLQSDDYLARQDADARLRALSDTDVGYDPKGTSGEIATGAERWRAWRLTLEDTGREE
jgi:hypothetical protein